MGSVAGYAVGALVAALGSFFVVVSVLARRTASPPSPRHIVGLTLQGVSIILLGVAIIVGRALFQLVTVAVLAEVASVVLLGPVHWKQLGSPDAWRGSRTK